MADHSSQTVFLNSADFTALSFGTKNNVLRSRREDAKITNEMHQSDVSKLLQFDGSVRAVIVCFADAEGVLHLLDYDKGFFVANHGGLTFDGSSIRGFTAQKESDLRLSPDFKTLRFLPQAVFGTGKVLMFADVLDKDGTPYRGDMRVRLKSYMEETKEKHGLTAKIAPEVEGVLLKGRNAEQHFDENVGLEPALETGYFHALPQSELRQFIDALAIATREMAFGNEKDHPEVGPGQFELNYGPADPVLMAENMLLYKLMARQLADAKGMTASFLPKPIQGQNGAGMHTNLSLEKDGENIFFDEKDPFHISAPARRAINSVLIHATEICLAISSSVNAYRRLDPHFEAPNEIKASPNDRGSMVRVPLAGRRSARMEVRSVAPDSNPYLVALLLMKAAVDGALSKSISEVKFASDDVKAAKLPGDIQTALEAFRKSEFVAQAMGVESREKYVALKEAVAERSPRLLGTRIKRQEILDHHEVRDQGSWGTF